MASNNNGNNNDIMNSLLESYIKAQSSERDYFKKDFFKDMDRDIDHYVDANQEMPDSKFDTYRAQEAELNKIFDLRVKHEREIADMKHNSNFYQLKAEQNFNKQRLSDMKSFYEDSRMLEDKNYQDNLKQQADIYQAAGARKEGLHKDEIKRLNQLEKQQLVIEENLKRVRERNQKSLFENIQDKLENTLPKMLNTLISHIGQDINKMTDYMYFDQVKAGMTQLQSAYESNFTPVAGYSGSDSRQENHDFIKSVLTEVNANDYTKHGLKFNEEVFPEITEAVKRGFTGDEASSIAISNAIDKKIMPWLETSSDTWTQLQFNMSEDRLQQIKGQQLLLQESREGNRLLQTGVVSTLLDIMQPTLLNIDANTTDVNDLSAQAQASIAYLMERGYGKQDAIKIATQAIDAYQNPAKALMNNGSPVEMLMAQTSLAGGDLQDIFKTYGDVATMGVGNGPIGAQAVSNVMGINNGGLTRTDDNFRDLAEMSAGMQKYIKEFSTNPEAARQKYIDKESNLPENVTATFSHDADIQNRISEQVFNFNNKVHGMDTVNMIYDEVVDFKKWVILGFTSLLAESLSKRFGDFL